MTLKRPETHGRAAGGGHYGGGHHRHYGGIGIYAPYFGYGVGYDDYPYYYNDYYEDGGCYLVRRRVLTRYGWHIRRVQVCY